MELHHPILLLLLLLVPGLVFFRYRRTRRSAFTFSDARVLRGAYQGWAIALQPLLPILFAGGLALLVVALAQPRQGLQESKVRTEVVDLLLLVDVSSSMRAEDFTTARKRKNRLESAKDVLRKFIGMRKEDRLGMVAFAALPYSMSPLTLDSAWLLKQVDRLSTDLLEDGTAIGSALASAVNRLRESEARSKIVILLTDGENNAGTISPEDAAQAAKALGIKVYTVGAGTDGWVPVPYDNPYGRVEFRRQWSQIDEVTLREIARITGGRYFRATDLASLESVYREIDRMEKTEVDVFYYTQYQQRYQPFVFAGMGLLFLEKLLALSRVGRIP